MNKDIISILIVDDEPEARELLTLMLDQVEGIELAGCAEKVDDALVLVEEKDPDLILLDIQMPGKSGFDLVESLRKMERNTGYIFITAYDEYAIRAVREAAFDYLLKPIDPAELELAIDRFREEWQQKILSDHIDSLLNNLGNGNRIKLNTRTGFMVIDPKDILYCKADGNYTEIVMVNDRREIISSNLGTMERELADDSFFRVSRSALVNLKYLTHVDNRTSTCCLQSETVIEIKVARNRLRKLDGLWGK